MEQRLSQLEALVGTQDTTVVREGERERAGGREGGGERERYSREYIHDYNVDVFCSLLCREGWMETREICRYG